MAQIVTDPEYRRNLASRLIESLERQRELMTAVATGGPRIDDVNEQYKVRQKEINRVLSQLGIENPNPFSDLWDWFGRWSSGDYPSYRSRRIFLRELFSKLIGYLEKLARGVPIEMEFKLTKWENVIRVIEKMRIQLARAEHKEDFQQIGLLVREALISLGQAVYKMEIHKTVDGVKPSDTDASRMLTAFIATELKGGANEETRSHAKASLRLAVGLQHKRTADFRMAAICSEATTSVVNIIAIVSGRRDPIKQK